MLFRIIEVSEFRGVLVQPGVGSKDRATALSLIPNNSPHGRRCRSLRGVRLLMEYELQLFGNFGDVCGNFSAKCMHVTALKLPQKNCSLASPRRAMRRRPARLLKQPR